MTIAQAIREILEDNPNLTKYRLAKNLETTQSQLNNWLIRGTVSPQIKSAKKFYDFYGIVIFPYTEKELRK